MTEKQKEAVKRLRYILEEVKIADDKIIEATSEIHLVLLNMKIESHRINETHGMGPIADRLAHIKDTIDNTTKGLIHTYRDELVELFTILLKEEDEE